MTVTLSIERDEKDIEVLVELTSFRGHRGFRGDGGQEEPDEEAEIEVDFATAPNGSIVELTKEEKEKAIELVCECV